MLGQVQSVDTISDQMSSMQRVFERGVMATVRIGCERFTWSITLSTLGIVPTRDKNYKNVLQAIDAVLPSRQRASLLPRDVMEKMGLLYPEQTERVIRKLFPTRYPDPTMPFDRRPSTPSGAQWLAIPLNGMTFVPVSGWQKWRSEFEAAKQAHLDGAQTIVDNYDILKRESLRHYTAIGIDVYNRLRLTSPENLPKRYGWNPETLRYEYISMDALSWIREWRKRVSEKWPSKSDILASYRVEPQFFWAPLSSSDSEPMQRLERIADGQLAQVSDEYIAFRQIRDEVLSTKRSRMHDLTTGYIRTILERVESVFMSFLKNAEAGTRGVTPRSVSLIQQVVQMVDVLGRDVTGLDGLKSEMQYIEKFLQEHQDEIEGKYGAKAKTNAVAVANENLPEILARTVEVLRNEAESMIGEEARRSMWEEDPTELLAAIRSGDSGTVRGRSSGFDGDNPNHDIGFTVVIDDIGQPAEAELVSSRRL